MGGLCYAIGSINLKPIGRYSMDDFAQDFALNAGAAAVAVQQAAPALQRGSGAVVLFSTVAARQGFASHAAVAMAKGAVEGLTVALAAELAPKVRVNCIAPSLVRTPLAGAMAEGKSGDKLGKMHLLGRLGEVEDVAPLAALLLGRESSWITGQVVGIDGGRSIGRAH